MTRYGAVACPGSLGQMEGVVVGGMGGKIQGTQKVKRYIEMQM